MRRYFYLIIVLFFNHCTTQNFIPHKPLHRGDNEISVGFNYSFNKMSFNSIQLSVFYGIDDRNVIGTSFNNFILPNNISYGHYWSGNNLSHSLQLHLNDILGSNFNPAYEFDYGSSYHYAEYSHSIKLGIGCFDLSLWYKAHGLKLAKSKIIPVIGYRFRNNSFYGDFQLLHGMNEYYIHYYKDDYLIRPRNQVSEYIIKEIGTSYKHSDIDTVIVEDEKYKFAFINGNTLIVDIRDPYPDCIGCGVVQNTHSAYPASGDHKVYWIYWKNQQERGSRYNNKYSPLMLELNMGQIIDNFNRGADLILKEDDDLADKSFLRAKSLWNNLIISTGYIERNTK